MLNKVFSSLVACLVIIGAPAVTMAAQSGNPTPSATPSSSAATSGTSIAGTVTSVSGSSVTVDVPDQGKKTFAFRSTAFGNQHPEVGETITGDISGNVITSGSIIQPPGSGK